MPASRQADTLLGKNLRRQRQDGHVPPGAVQRTDPPRGLKPVHAGHANIHQHDVKLTLRHCLDRFGATWHAAHHMPGSLQERPRDVPVDR